jgi:hypothetical protein
VAATEPAHPGRRRLLRAALVVLIAGAIAFALGSQWRRLPSFPWRFEPAWLAVSALAFLGMLSLHAEGWRQILAALGYRLPSPVARLIWAKSLLARYVPTNALLVVTRVTMTGRVGVPRRVVLASIVYELALQVAAALAVGAYFVVELEPLQGQPLRYAVVVLPLLAVAGLHPAIFHRAADFVFARLGRDPLPLSLPFARVIGLAAFYAFSFVVAGVGIATFTESLYPVEAAGLPALVAAWAVGFGVAVVAFFAPAGFGAREAGLAAALAAAVPTEVAVAVAIAARILVTSVELVFAGLSTMAARGRAGALDEVEGSGDPPVEPERIQGPRHREPG